MNISIRRLKKTYETQQVLDIEQMQFEKGLTCIMGDNGSGKSTLLNILSGQLGYEYGSIEYDGRFYSKSLAKDITLVHQKPHMLNRSVLENVMYPLLVRGVSRYDATRLSMAILDRFGILELRNKNGTSLSGGEAQKVALARGMVFEPTLLMLDEPTSNMDEGSLGFYETIITNYAAKGRTVLMVTHDPYQARNMSKRIVRL